MQIPYPVRHKIAVAIPYYGLVGGGELFASKITESLAENENYEIHVFANRWKASSDRIIFHKVPIIRFPGWLRALSFAWFARHMIDRMNFDLIHTHDWIFTGDICSVHSVPHAEWIYGVRKKRIPSLFDLMRMAVERKTIMKGSAARFFPVSSIAIDAFKRRYKILPGNWQALAPGVDVARFATPDRLACRAVIRGKYNIAETDFLLLFVGMSFDVKGLDTIIAALAKAKALKPDKNIRLLVVGRGNKNQYLKIAQSLGIADAVIFAGTQVEGLEQYYRAADAFIMLSKFDTFGMVVLEAMAAGIPVILSPNVGAKDLVEEGINGFVIPEYRDSDAAAERIVQLLDSERCATMGSSASQTASEHDWQRLAEKMGQLYKNILFEL